MMVGICGHNSPEWIYLYISLIFSSFTAVPLDVTLDDERIKYICQSTEIKVLFVSFKMFDKMKKLFGTEELKTIETVILFDDLEQRPEGQEIESASNQEPAIFMLDELCKDFPGEKYKDENPIRTYNTPDAMVILIHTSGSTGVPKGAIRHDELCHRDIKKVNFFSFYSED